MVREMPGEAVRPVGRKRARHEAASGTRAEWQQVGVREG